MSWKEKVACVGVKDGYFSKYVEVITTMPTTQKINTNYRELIIHNLI